MFDQNWLKRYMLSNQSGADADENVGAGLGTRPSRPPMPPLSEQTPVERHPVRETSVLQERAVCADGGSRPVVPALDGSASRLMPGASVASARSGHGAISSTAPPGHPSSARVNTPGRVTPGRHTADVSGGRLYPSSGPVSEAGASRFGAQPNQEAAAALANAEFARTSGTKLDENRPPTTQSPWNMHVPNAGAPGWPGGALGVPGLGPGVGLPDVAGVGPGAFGFTPFDAGAGQVNLWNYGNETGPKHFVVMCKDDVELRASPTYADDTRIGHFLHPGQVVVIDNRRMVSGSWFLHLADGRGWTFESKERLLVMTEAHDFERGLWHYSVLCDDDVETRMTPTYSDDARTGVILASGDCIAVDERCSVAGARFLKLADGRGWVFETKDRLLVMGEVRAKAQEARDFARGLWHYTVVCDDDVEIRAAPTYSDEARTGLMVHPGDCVAVDERCRVAAVWFLRLSDGRGWVFETKDSRRVMMLLH